MITYRPGPSFAPLDETMKQQKKFNNMDDFLQYLKEKYNKENYTITLEYYSEEDKRTGWSNIFLVKIKNAPYGKVTFDKVKDGTMFDKEGKEVIS